jgi:hypothetical protein
MKYSYENERLIFDNNNSLLKMGYIAAGDLCISFYPSKDINIDKFIIDQSNEEVFNLTKKLYQKIIITSKAKNMNMDLFKFDNGELLIDDYNATEEMTNINRFSISKEDNNYVFTFYKGEDPINNSVRINIERIYGSGLLYTLLLVDYYRSMKDSCFKKDSRLILKK